MNIDFVVFYASVASFVIGVLITYAYMNRKREDTLVNLINDNAAAHLNLQRTINDELIHIADTLNESKATTHEKIMAIANDTHWEIDTVYNDYSDTLHVYQPETPFTMDHVIEITIDDDTTYTIALQKRVYQSVKKMLKAKEAQQILTDEADSIRPYADALPLPAPVPDKLPDPPAEIIVNPAILRMLEAKKNQANTQESA
jgi:hypothetical protein